MLFYEKIKNLRVEKGLYQRELADLIKTSNSTICDWERGRCEPSIQDLIKLSNIFNCSVDYLIGNEDDFGIISSADNNLTYEENRIIEIYRTLSDRDKKMVDNIFNSFVSDVPQKNVRA